MHKDIPVEKVKVQLPDASVNGSRERVVAALGHFDVDVSDQKVVVNLSPSEHKKNGQLIEYCKFNRNLSDFVERWVISCGIYFRFSTIFILAWAGKVFINQYL